MKIRHAVAGITIGVGVIAAAPQLTSAHVPDIEVSCATGINVTLSRYSGTDHVTIWKDDTVIADTDFTGSYDFHRGFTRTTSHTWRVKVSAGNENSPDVSGTVDACAEATTTTTTTSAPAESTTTSIVATDVPPVPSTTAPSTTLEPAVPQTPTTAAAIPCVLDATGHYNWQGTTNPCQGPAVALVDDTPATPVTTAAVSLPSTGAASTSIVWLAVALFGLGVILLVARRFPSWK